MKRTRSSNSIIKKTAVLLTSMAGRCCVTKKALQTSFLVCVGGCMCVLHALHVFVFPPVARQWALDLAGHRASVECSSPGI